MIGIRTHNFSGDWYRLNRNIKQYIIYVVITAPCILILRRDRYRIVVMDLQLPIQSVPISVLDTTECDKVCQ